MSNQHRGLVVAVAVLAMLSFGAPAAYGEELKGVRQLTGEKIDTKAVVQAAAARKLPQGISPGDQEALKRVVGDLKAGRLEPANASWRSFSQGYFSKGTAANLDALIQWVLRESYLETNKDLAFAADKVRFYNEQKKALREYVDKLGKALAKAKTDELVRIRPIRVEESFLKGKEAVSWGPWKTVTRAQASAEIDNLEKRLSSIGDDAQLANIDLQNKLQQQQQTLQTMSNVSKMLQATARGVVMEDRPSPKPPVGY